VKEPVVNYAFALSAPPGAAFSGSPAWAADSAAAEPQVVSQIWGVGTAIVWSGVVVDKLVGLREGLDIASHGESAYRY
jgi:hypothetical protein